MLTLFLGCSSFLSASEAALFSLSPLTLKVYKSSRDLRFVSLAKMMSKPREVIVTILIINILSNIFVQNIVSSLVGAFPEWIFKVGIPLILTLVFGELLPKSIAVSNNSIVAYRTFPVIHVLEKILRPFRKPLTKITGWMARTLFSFLPKETEISAEEFYHVLKVSKESEVLLPQECDLTAGCLNLQNSLVKEHMRPKEEILFYSMHEPLNKLYSLFVDLEVSRIPVCGENLDHLLGILSAKRFFFNKDHIKKPADLISILKKPYYAPESMRAWALLNRLRNTGENLAIVVDEYSSVSGLASQEDLIEAVVGTISDRRDTQDLYTRSSEDVVIVSGKLELSDFVKIFGIPLKSQRNAMTLNGWLIEQLEGIPLPGTKYLSDHFLFYILSADPNRIRRVYIRKLNKEA